MRIDLTKKISSQELAKPVREHMSTFDFSFPFEMTVEEVFQALQAKTVHRHVDYFYVVDKEQFLLGLVTMKDLLHYSARTRLGEIIEKDVAKVFEDDPLEKALKALAHHKILVLPVVTEENRLVGVIEVIPPATEHSFQSRRIQEKNLKEDLFQLIGFTIEQGKWTSSWTEFRYRMPWLACNLFGGLICATIGEVYQLTLVEFVILALFIPLVLTLSESVAIQAMTLSLRFIHLRKIYWSQVWRRLFSEWKTSALLALASTFAIGCFYFAWSSDIKPIIAIGSSLFIAMISSATCGALLPIALHSLHLDPKVAAGPVALMIADIITITIYLSVSTVFLL